MVATVDVERMVTEYEYWCYFHPWWFRRRDGIDFVVDHLVHDEASFCDCPIVLDWLVRGTYSNDDGDVVAAVELSDAPL